MLVRQDGCLLLMLGGMEFEGRMDSHVFEGGLQHKDGMSLSWGSLNYDEYIEEYEEAIGQESAVLS